MNHTFMLLCAKLIAAKQNFLEEERGAVDIVAIVVMIGIAVLLAVFFREQISDLLETLFGTITTNATKAVGP